MIRNELIEKMKKARSWKELGMSIKEVCEILESECDCKRNNENSENEEILKLREKTERLAESNKQLRAENKALKESR